MGKDRAVELTGPVTADPQRDGLLAPDLLARARTGDKQAWDALVERYAPLIWSICRTYQFGHADARDVGQRVWLRLVDQLGKIHDPAALPGWLAAMTWWECVRALYTARRPRARLAFDLGDLLDDQGGPAGQKLLAAERHAALREAFDRLPPAGQQLVAMLIADPPVPYTEISARLGIPVGSIGPNRARYLDKLRRDPAIAALINGP